MVINLILGFVLALAIAFAARQAHALNPSGAAAAVLLGTLIFGLGGLGWAILLMAFFTSSSALSRLFRRQKRGVEEKFSKGSERDAGQVLANGGAAGLFAMLHVAYPQSAWPWLGCAAALAAANADTWATELGVLSRLEPRLITSGKVVERGASGGVSLAGTLAALAGSGLIAVLGALFWMGHTGLDARGLPGGLANLLGAAPIRPEPGLVMGSFILLALSGLAGSLVDSLLGATVQTMYYCPSCEKETERTPTHTCGTLTQPLRGWKWLDNDWVNLACTFAAALIALGVGVAVGMV